MDKKRCFVISPIGQADSETLSHADDVFEFIIEKAMQKLKKEFDVEIEAVRADHLQEVGEITQQIFDEILNADLCVAILTDHNPNVFYELAVAQAAARPVIILIEKGQRLPFDVQDLRSVHYALQPVKALVEGVYANQMFDLVKSIHENGWTTPGLFESYGYGRQLRFEQQLLQMFKTARPKPLPVGRDKVDVMPFNSKQHIEVVTGDIKELDVLIKELKTSDALLPNVIVSLESTDLQLARFYDPWLSGTLRYLDAEKEPGGRVLRDSLYEELQEQLIKRGTVAPSPGSVIATPTNQLDRLGFKYVFHVAVMQGAIGDGYHTMEYLLDDCIQNVFSQFAELTQADLVADHPKLHTILFPMLGAGTTGLDAIKVAEKILPSIRNGLQAAPACRKVYLLTWLEPHLHAVHQVAAKLELQEVPVGGEVVS